MDVIPGGCRAYTRSMEHKPAVSVYISVAHQAGGVTTIAHCSAYALDQSEQITVDDVSLAAMIAAKKFGLSLSDKLGDIAESYRVARERNPGTL